MAGSEVAGSEVPGSEAKSETGSGQPSAIRWERDDEGIVVLTFDDPEHSANTLNAAYRAAIAPTLERLLAERDQITGVVLTSAKKTFFAGADLAELLRFEPGQETDVVAFIEGVKAPLRALEQLGRPVVAALNGTALGGGFEIALAAHHRVMADAPGAVVGFPEVGLGLLPGAGGVSRVVRMIGLITSLKEVLTTGRRFGPQAAAELGLVDDVVAPADLLDAAKAWIRANPEAGQPWDRPGFRIPGGSPADSKVGMLLPTLPAAVRQQLRGAPMPAPRAILAAAVEGAEVDIDTALAIESRYFAGLVTSPVAKNLINSTFFDLREVNAGASRPPGVAPQKVTRIGVIGAGMMGAAIAYVSAKAGVEVTLNDVELAKAERGKGYSERLVGQDVAKGRSTEDAAQALLGRITPTANLGELAGVDLVIEAVFESIDLKREVYGRLNAVVGPETLIGSNTSTLPITELGQAIAQPGRFVGIHFFSPVDKMRLVELINGDDTAPETLAAAFDFARQIGKTPIVVNDRRGFFTSRVIMTFLHEAVAALGEGVEPASIEQAGLQAGYPAAPLQLIDELTLTLTQKIRTEAEEAAKAAGEPWAQHGSYAVIDRLIDEYGRTGRTGRAGFYDYDEAGKRTGLWPGLREAFDSGRSRPPLVDLQERMLFAESLESIRCLDEGVLNSVTDANVGSLLGIGFPAWTGGVLRYVDSYPGGPAGFVRRADELADAYGEQFRPPQSLRDKAARGERYCH